MTAQGKLITVLYSDWRAVKIWEGVASDEIITGFLSLYEIVVTKIEPSKTDPLSRSVHLSNGDVLPAMVMVDEGENVRY